MDKKLQNHIRIVLVETTHPGNIGAAARAMKTMGFYDLHLVRPKIFPHADATARAAGADDILESAKMHESLADALSECSIVFATSARIRTLPCPMLSPSEAIPEIIEFAARQVSVALVFGRESSGLTNEELDLCNKMITIPTGDQFSSLNLASAVQIICYEVFKLIKGDDHKNQKFICLANNFIYFIL